MGVIDLLKPEAELSSRAGMPQTLIERADLVTEMKEIKHYYTKEQKPEKESSISVSLLREQNVDKLYVKICLLKTGVSLQLIMNI